MTARIIRAESDCDAVTAQNHNVVSGAFAIFATLAVAESAETRVFAYI
jgi:hypothetical protein